MKYLFFFFAAIGVAIFIYGMSIEPSAASLRDAAVNGQGRLLVELSDKVELAETIRLGGAVLAGIAAFFGILMAVVEKPKNPTEA